MDVLLFLQQPCQQMEILRSFYLQREDHMVKHTTMASVVHVSSWYYICVHKQELNLYFQSQPPLSLACIVQCTISAHCAMVLLTNSPIISRHIVYKCIIIMKNKVKVQQCFQKKFSHKLCYYY